MPKIWKIGFGRWFRTLRYYTRLNIDEWRGYNPTIRELRHNAIHAFLIVGSQHLATAMGMLLALGGLTSVIIWRAQPALSAKWSFWAVKGDMAAMFTTVWTVQVTLAAVVYPIVIGFLTLLFQQRPASSVRVMVYLNDSGAKLSGLSSLILCLVAAVQWFFCKAVGEEVQLGWVLFDTVWLGLNTAGSVFFLYRTFDVLQAKKAEHIVRLLGWAIGRWLARAESAGKSPAGRQRGPGLYFPAFPDQSFTDGVDLCRVDGTILPTDFERRVIRWAYRMGRWRHRALEPTINDLMEELSRDVLDDIEKRQLVRARVGLKVMRDLHAEVLNAGQYLAEGQRSNYARLSSLRLTNVPWHDDWARQYFAIFEASASAVSEEHGYFETVSYLSGHLFAETRMLRDIEIGDRIISLGRLAMLKLGRWWVGEIDKLGLAPTGPCAPAILDARSRRNYEEALRAFTGAWEQIPQYYFNYGTRSKRAPWDDLKLTAHFQLTHLNDTLLIFFDAVARGDRQCAEAIADILKQWKPSIDLGLHVDSFMLRTPYLLTMALMGGDEAALQVDVQFPEYIEMKRDLTGTVMAVVFDNLWTDAMLVGAYCLTQWGKDCACDKSLAAQFIPHFLRQRLESPRPVNTPLDRMEIENAFWSMIRQHFSDKNYHGQINGLVERIQGIRSEPMVMGRIYAHWGTSDLDSLRDSQLIVLCLLIRAGWRAESGHDHDILKLLGWEPDRGETIGRWFEQLLARLADPTFTSWDGFFRCVAGPLSQELTFEQAIAEVQQTLSQFRQAVRAAYDTTLQQTPIDPRELDRFAGWASEKGFVKATGAVPVSLFADIRYVAEELPERHVVFNKIDRGKFTSPRRSTLPSREDHFVAESIKDLAGA